MIRQNKDNAWKLPLHDEVLSSTLIMVWFLALSMIHHKVQCKLSSTQSEEILQCKLCELALSILSVWLSWVWSADWWLPPRVRMDWCSSFRVRQWAVWKACLAQHNSRSHDLSPTACTGKNLNRPLRRRVGCELRENSKKQNAALVTMPQITWRPWPIFRMHYKTLIERMSTRNWNPLRLNGPSHFPLRKPPREMKNNLEANIRLASAAAKSARPWWKALFLRRKLRHAKHATPPTLHYCRVRFHHVLVKNWRTD